eukprot:8291417-Ditylum_brightwellii.AAC.1
MQKKQRRFFFSFHVEGFECVFPSKEIFGYIREQSVDPINVVSLRWMSSGKAVLANSDLGSPQFILNALKLNDDTSDSEDGLFNEVVQRYGEHARPLSSNIFASRATLAVQGFQ